MSNTPNSFIVSSPTKGNYETAPLTDETSHETAMKPLDLMSLAACALERNQCNLSGNPQATIEFLANETKNSQVDTCLKQKSFTVSIHKRGNHETNELQRLIKQVSNMYGGDNDPFLAEYIHHVITAWSHNLDEALVCFRELADQKLYRQKGIMKTATEMNNMD